MKVKRFGLVLLLAASMNPFCSQALELTSKTGNCQDNGINPLSSIGSDIISSVAISLVGTAVDAIAMYLSTPQITSAETTLPVNDLSGLDGGKCLIIHGRQGDENDLIAKIAFVSSSKSSGKERIFRPVVLEWNYPKSFMKNTRAFRSNDKRDVLITLEFFSPSAIFTGLSPASTPVGVMAEDATLTGLDGIFAGGKGASLPWVKLAETDGPVNIRFKIMETSKPGAFSAALGAAIKAQKSTIQDKVKERFTDVSESAEATAMLELVNGAQKAAASYQSSYATAAATLLAIRTEGEDTDLTALRIRYLTERETARLNLILAKAAFQIAGIDWPADGFGDLPENP